MFSVMLVDDERPSRELLRLMIDWEDAGFSIVCEANNGKDALSKYFIYKPDLVITDIQMPIMDGLMLIQHIKRANADQIIIVLSCHELFDYARSAIKLGVSDYLIKDTLTPDELLDTLLRVKKTLPVNDVSVGAFRLPVQISDCSPRIRKIVEYILQNYETDINLSTLAETFDVHKTYLARVFKNETGMSIYETVLKLRIEKAKQLLSNPDMAVTSIIEKVGFRSPQSFYTLFKKHTGLSPSEYRDKMT
ncbi:MAG: response regulator [Oscillospiraceae bacterium]|nr:response regulator [Oscillospiraceae bacterium]